jgi:hypothetical protein
MEHPKVARFRDVSLAYSHAAVESEFPGLSHHTAKRGIPIRIWMDTGVGELHL